MTPRLAAPLVFLTVSVSFAQDLGPKSEPAAMSLNYNPLVWQGDDAQFAIDTEHTSYCQAQFSKQVAAKITDDNLLTIARTSARQQETLYRKLKAMARALNFEYPPKRTLQDCPALQKAQTLDGTDLAWVYVNYLRDTNNAAIQEFQAQIARPEKPDNYSLRKLAEKTLPDLQDLQAKLSTLGSAAKP